MCYLLKLSNNLQSKINRAADDSTKDVISHQIVQDFRPGELLPFAKLKWIRKRTVNMRCGTGTSLACREVPTIQVRDRNSRRCKGQLPARLRKIFLIIIIDNVKFTDLTYLSNPFFK